MKNLTIKALVASVLGIVVLTGCGGGGGGSSAPSAQANAVTTIPASGVVNYVADLQASTTSDSAEARDISLIDMAVDDTAEPGAV